MDTLIYLFIIATLVTAALAGLAIWAPRRSWVRISAVAVAACVIPISYVQFVEFLSKPKPQSFEWFERNVEEADILAVILDEGRAIYMWLRLDGAVAPRFYEFPWNLKLAERLEEDIETAATRQHRLVLKNPFQKRPDGEPLGDLNIQIVPPPLQPLKKPQMPPRIFNPRHKEAAAGSTRQGA